MKKIAILTVGLFLAAGCGAASKNIGSVRLQLSNRDIEAVQHRSDSQGCAELVVLQTYDAQGALIDSKEGRATSLPCALIGGVLEAGAHVGSAAIIANGVSRAAKAAANASNSLTITNSNSNTGSVPVAGDPATGGNGNNGRGNGSGDGTNPGTGHHHNNGDND